MSLSPLDFEAIQHGYEKHRVDARYDMSTLAIKIAYMLNGKNPKAEKILQAERELKELEYLFSNEPVISKEESQTLQKAADYWKQRNS